MPVRVRSNAGCDHLLGEACERCDQDRKKPIGRPRLATAFQTGVYEHLHGPMEKSIEITSPRQLYEEARKRGSFSHYLQESEIHPGYKRDSNRWI